MHTQKVKDFMTTDVFYATSCMTLQEASRRMKDFECGFLPVGSKDKVFGVITDRDIAIRAVCEGVDIATELVADYMTKPVIACNENDTLEDAIDKMHAQEISRLLVKNKNGTVTGILSPREYLSRFAKSNEIANVVKHALATITA